MIETKKLRRLEVGPHACFYFENYDTMWMQVHEMLLIEKGGEDQIPDELRAYNSLIPQGQELVATVMLEIEDALQRARTLARLPEAADTPVVQKVDGDARPILWIALVSDQYSGMELTELARRRFADRLAIVEGVAQVLVLGERKPAMRIWLDRQALAARGLTVQDIEDAIKRENVELPGGRIESTQRELTVRTDTPSNSAASAWLRPWYQSRSKTSRSSFGRAPICSWNSPQSARRPGSSAPLIAPARLSVSSWPAPFTHCSASSCMPA